MSLAERAKWFAIGAHGEQTRKDGKTPYYLHPVRVMNKLAMYGIEDPELLAAAVLHDVLEDTPITSRTLTNHFGDWVNSLVVELTKDYASGARDLTRRAYVERFRTASPEACLIKLVDRADNLRDDFSWGPKYRSTYASEGLSFLLAVKENMKVRDYLLTQDDYAVAFQLACEDLQKVCLEEP